MLFIISNLNFGIGVLVDPPGSEFHTSVQNLYWDIIPSLIVSFSWFLWLQLKLTLLVQVFPSLLRPLGPLVLWNIRCV